MEMIDWRTLMPVDPAVQTPRKHTQNTQNPPSTPSFVNFGDINRGPKVKTEPSRWLAAWRRLAQITRDIPKDDPRHESILTALDDCDEAFLADDWHAFQVKADHIERLVERRG
jgi:hypothetical protein